MITIELGIRNVKSEELTPEQMEEVAARMRREAKNFLAESGIFVEEGSYAHIFSNGHGAKSSTSLFRKVHETFSDL